MVGEFIVEYWQQIVAVVAFVIWVSRLESKTINSFEEIKRLEKKFDDNETNRIRQRAEDMQSIHIALRDIQVDIKEILRTR